LEENFKLQILVNLENLDFVLVLESYLLVDNLIWGKCTKTFFNFLVKFSDTPYLLLTLMCAGVCVWERDRERERERERVNPGFNPPSSPQTLHLHHHHSSYHFLLLFSTWRFVRNEIIRKKIRLIWRAWGTI